MVLFKHKLTCIVILYVTYTPEPVLLPHKLMRDNFNSCFFSPSKSKRHSNNHCNFMANFLWHNIYSYYFIRVPTIPPPHPRSSLLSLVLSDTLNILMWSVIVLIILFNNSILLPCYYILHNGRGQLFRKWKPWGKLVCLCYELIQTFLFFTPSTFIL